MKYIEKYLKDIIKVKPLGKLTTEEDELDGISGEMVYIDGKCSNIFISHIDYANWLEKQGENNKPLYIRFGDIPKDEKSKVYNGEIEIGTEKGVSVYPAFEDLEGNIVLGLSLPITKTSLYTQQYLLEYDNRACYLVSGDYVGKGTDGEPLLRNIKIIREIKDFRVNQSEQKSANSYCQENCKGFQETGKCFADGDCKAKREAESTNKVKQRSINEIEIPFGAKDSELQEATYYIPKGFYAEIDDDKVVIKKGEKHTAWSEENRKRIQRISDFIWKNRKGDTDDIYQQEQDVKWLKSFRPQPKQEWSEEDECCMAECINAIATKDGWSFEEKRKTKHWLKSLKDRVSCEANYITTKEWSEEDERNMQNISLNLV